MKQPYSPFAQATCKNSRSELHGNNSLHAFFKTPERLLSAVLFWNLAINIAYFASATIIEHQLPHRSWVWPLRIASLLLIIFFSEMLPKTIAVLATRQLSAWISIPLSIMIRLVDPIMPWLLGVMQASRRLFWPSFKAEEGLATADLERAIKLSATDAKLLDQERTILENIVSMSDVRADEAMRPNTQLQVFRPPVRLADLHGRKTRSGYLFLTDGSSDNISMAVRLESLWSLNCDHLESAADSVVYVPWCATLADVSGLLLTKHREVAAVVNEYGETIGAITTDDLMDVLFTEHSSRSNRLLNRDPILELAPDLWQATSMTNLRRLAEFFNVDLPSSQNKTIGGVIQESLQRVPETDDRCDWGQFEFAVVGAEPDGQLQVQIRRSQQQESD